MRLVVGPAHLFQKRHTSPAQSLHTSPAHLHTSPAHLHTLPARFVLILAQLAILTLLASAPPARGQDPSWASHTSMREVTGVSASPDAVWAATTGGVFRYAVDGGEMSTYTASDGLHNVQTQAIAYDAVRDLVWIGYRSGVLDRLDPSTGTIRTYRDIERADRFTSREIREIVVHGDSVLIATSFGLVVFDPVRGEVRDTYSQLGSISAGTAVYDVVVAPGPDGSSSFWLATNDGIAHAALETPNLQDPTVWTVERAGLPSTETRTIAQFDGSIYVGTATDLARREPDGTFARLNRSNNGVLDLVQVGDRLIGAERFNLIVIDAGGASGLISFQPFSNPVVLTEGSDGLLWVGDTEGGLVAVEPPARTDSEVVVVRGDVYPSGPYDNLFNDLAMSPDGTLWTTGEAGAESGFFRFNPEDGWANFTSRFVPELAGKNSFERLHIESDGRVWAGSAGHGVVEVTPDGTVRTYDPSNSSIRPAAGTSGFVIVGGIASDDAGNAWFTNRASPFPLHVRSPDGDWNGISRLTCDGFSQTGLTFDSIFIDSFDQKWIIVLDEANLRRVVGLLVLDTNATPSTTDDDACRFFSSEGSGGQGLPGVAVTSIAEDRDGIVWIGTDKGLAFVINSGIVAQDQTSMPIWPQLADRTQGTFLMNGISINDVAVDPANRLWVATDQGVSIVQQVEGGYELVETFTAANSPLFSNVVVSLAVDALSGHVYMATDQGLISYESDAVAASEQVETLKVYPNPVRIRDGAEPSIYVDGLVDETELRVVTLDGNVVARMETRGGRARWDGRDVTGTLVPSGVYLVVAVGTNGEGAAYGKVAVIR